MKNAAVVYWSGTGNTAAMAEAVAAGITGAGAAADVIEAGAFDAGKVDSYDAFAFGCPAMGAEVLEECEFEPMFLSVEGSLGAKPVALFGSYGWGDGQWMRDWVDRCQSEGIQLVNDGLMVNGEPDETALEECRELGKELVS